MQFISKEPVPRRQCVSAHWPAQLLGLYVPQSIARTYDMAGAAFGRQARGPPGPPPGEQHLALGPSPAACSTGGARASSRAAPGAADAPETLGSAETRGLALVCCAPDAAEGHGCAGTPSGSPGAPAADTPGSGSETLNPGEAEALNLALALVDPAAAAASDAGGAPQQQGSGVSALAARGGSAGTQGALCSGEGTSARGGARLSSSAELEPRSCGGAETSPVQARRSHAQQTATRVTYLPVCCFVVL